MKLIFDRLGITKKRDKVTLPLNVDEKGKVIFIHIPKTAGSSISESLGLKITSHATALQTKSVLGKRKFNKYFKFSVVRNPWSRFLSLYNYARLEESKYHSAINPENAIYGKHLDYDLLKNASVEDCAVYLEEGKLKHDKGWNHWKPQADWLLDESGKMLVDHIIRFENLNEDFVFIQKKLALAEQLPFLNKSTHTREDYRPYYTEKSKQIIEAYYAKDMELFGYNF